MRTRPAGLVIAALAILAVAQPASASQPPVWGEPVQIGADLPSSWFPDLNVDAAGNVRLVWSASLIEGDANLTDDLVGAVIFSELRNGAWTPPRDIFVMDGGIASRPIIASDGQYVHAIFRTSPPGVPTRLVYSRAAISANLSDAKSWSTPYRLSSDEAYWGQIATLPDGGLAVVYNNITQVATAAGVDRRTGLFARRSPDQGTTWLPAVRIAETTERVARTSLAVVPGSDRLIVAWDEGYDNITAQGEPSAVGVAVSEDGGATWTSHHRFPGAFQQSVVATDGATTMLVYRATTEDALLYRLSDDLGASWSDETAIPGVVARPYPGRHNFDKLSLAFDGDGRLLLAYVGANSAAPNGLSVMVASYADGAWTEPEVIASPVGYPEYPRIAVALGNQVYLAYFVRDKQFDIGAYTMWVVAGRSDARGIPPTAFAPIPTPTPAPTPTPPPALVVHPTVPAPPQPLAPEQAGPTALPHDRLIAPVQRIVALTAAAAAALAGAWALVALVVRPRL